MKAKWKRWHTVVFTLCMMVFVGVFLVDRAILSNQIDQFKRDLVVQEKTHQELKAKIKKLQKEVQIKGIQKELCSLEGRFLWIELERNLTPEAAAKEQKCFLNRMRWLCKRLPAGKQPGETKRFLESDLVALHQ